MRESWKNVFGVLENPGKVLEIFLNKSVGTLCLECMWCCVVLFLVVSTSAVDCLQRLVSDLLAVEWDVKPYTLTLHSNPYRLNCHAGVMMMFDKLCRKRYSSSTHRTETVTVMGHELNTL